MEINKKFTIVNDASLTKNILQAAKKCATTKS